MIKRIKIFYSVFLFLFIFSGTGTAQEFPEKPVPPRLVNDFAGMLSENEAGILEHKLVAFDDSTSTQIAIVILSDLKGYAPADYAQRLAEKWGIGQKGLDNGILILIKTRTSISRGEVFIAPGYGLEGVVPDLLCKEITDNEILPSFRQDKYFEGLDKGTDVLMSLVRGTFPPDKYNKSGKAGGIAPFIFIIIIIVLILFIRSSGGKNQRHISNKGLPIWLLLTMMNSGKGSHSGSWGGFSGGGGFGGGGGGFGGFGGGSFGGGGAGGSW